MDLIRNHLFLIRAVPDRTDPTTITFSNVCKWDVPNSIGDSRIQCTIDRMCNEDLGDKCRVVERCNMGDWNGQPMTEYVFGCGDPWERYAFFFDDTPEPSTCPFCGRRIADGGEER